MELTKTVSSRNGNNYIIQFETRRELIDYEVKDDHGELIYQGTSGIHKNNGENDLIETVTNIILYMEENYSDYDSLKEFEEWDGVIE